MQKSIIKAALFDFDGSLASLTLDFKEMRKLSFEHITTIIPQIKASIIDLPSMEMIKEAKIYLNNIKEEEQANRLEESTLRVIKKFELACAKKSNLFKETMPLLNFLNNREIAVGIITRNCKEVIATVFPDYEKHTTLISRDDTTRVKPDPEHLYTALRKMGNIPPSEAFMAGDHVSDIIAAKRAGCISIAILTGESNEAELMDCKPDYLFKDLNGIYDLIR